MDIELDLCLQQEALQKRQRLEELTLETELQKSKENETRLRFEMQIQHGNRCVSLTPAQLSHKMIYDGRGVHFWFEANRLKFMCVSSDGTSFSAGNARQASFFT